MEPINAYELYQYCCDKSEIVPLTKREWEANGKPTFEQYTGKKFDFPRPSTQPTRTMYGRRKAR